MFLRATSMASIAAILLAAPLTESPSNTFEADSTHIKTFSETSSFEMISLTYSENGVKVDLGDASMTGQFSRSFQITDHYVKVEDQRATRRIRQLEECEGNVETSLSILGLEEAHAAELSNPLDGFDIRCDWDEKSGSYSFTYDEDNDADDSLLEGMHIDAEFNLLPPADEVSESDSWTVELSEGGGFFAPGGVLVWEAEMDQQPFMNLKPQSLLSIALLNLGDAAQEVEGQIEVTWSDTLTRDGRKLALLELDIEVELTAELGERLNALCASAGALDPNAEQSCTWVVEGSGQVLWDLEAGHFHSLELEYESEVEFLLSWEADGSPVEVEVEMEAITQFRAEHESE